MYVKAPNLKCGVRTVYLPSIRSSPIFLLAMATDEGFASASAALFCYSLPPSLQPRRLSSTFSEPTHPIVSTRRQLRRVLFHGSPVGDAETNSPPVDGKCEWVAWELFTPLHRALLVAIIAVASADSKRSRRITQLQRSIEIKDEVLRNMQAKLDDLCEQTRLIKDQSSTSGCQISLDNEHFVIGEIAKANEAKFCPYGTRVLHLNPDSGIIPLCSSRSIKTKDVYTTELSQERVFLNNHEIASEQEERRMSDLSDFCCSVASSADFQPVELSTLAAEQELYNLRNECEEKDATIKELREAAHSSSIAFSKRIAELEEVIRRKNMITTKLKKDVLFLEQQMSKLMRLRRQSSSSSSSSAASTSKQLPFMSENILYDMSSTSSSSSDCDSPDRNGANLILRRSMEHSRQALTQHLSSFDSEKWRSLSPLMENRMNRQTETNPTVRQCLFVSSSVDDKKARRRTLQEEKMMYSHKKWI